MHIVTFSLLNNLKSKPITAHVPKGSESTGDSACSLPEPILAAFQMRHKITILNSYHGFAIQALYERRKIEVMNLRELPRAESMVAVLSVSMMFRAEWNR